MKLECILGINIDGYRIRQGAVLSDADTKTARFMEIAQLKTKNFVAIENDPMPPVDEPMTISDIAKARQFAPTAKKRK